MTTQVQPQDKTITTNGLNLNYLDWGGEGKTKVLLLHGFRGHRHSWDDFSAAVCKDYHVLALDQRGRGQSDWAKDGDYTTDAFVADLAGLRDALSLEPFILVGHSMGGRNSMTFAARYPNNLRQLVLVDIGPDLEPRGAERLRQEVINVPEEFDSFDALVDYMSKQNRFASDRVLRRRLQYASKELSSGKFGWRYDPEIREQRRAGDVASNSDLWPELPKITCPTLLVRGLETDLLATETAQRMVDTIPNCQMVEIPQAGHMVFEDNPDGFHEVVRPFLS